MFLLRVKKVCFGFKLYIGYFCSANHVKVSPAAGGRNLFAKSERTDSMSLIEDKKYTEEEYERIDSNALVEYDNGRIIMMAPPSGIHQELVTTLSYLIKGYLAEKPCKIYVSPFNVRLALYGVSRLPANPAIGNGPFL